MFEVQGIYVYDESNQRYIDCIAGYSALIKVIVIQILSKFAKKQMNKLTLTSRYFIITKWVILKIAKTFHMIKFFLMNGGVESEKSLKLPGMGL